MHSGFKLQLYCSYQVQEKLVQTRSGIEGKDFYLSVFNKYVPQA